MAPKYPALSTPAKYTTWNFHFSPSLGLPMTAWDHYFSPSYPKTPSCPQNTQLCRYHKTPKLGIFLSTSLGFLGHGTAWDHYKMENYLHPTPKNTQLPQNTQLRRIPIFLSTSVGFWDMGQHGTNGKLPENKFWSLCQHPLALGRPGLKKNVVSLGAMMVGGCGKAAAL